MTGGPAYAYLGFDFGTKRIGVAMGQSITQTATALTTIRWLTGDPDWAHIDTLVAAWQPAALIVGLPLNADDTEHAISQMARGFGNQLNSRYNLIVHLIDERLSSHEASQINRGKNKMREIDAIAAQVILQSWLNRPIGAKHDAI